MPKEVVALEVSADSSLAEKSIKQLKQEIETTTQEVERLTQAYGKNSEQVQAASKRLAQVQDVANEKIEAQNQKIDDAAKTITALSAAYGGVQGALELTGLAGEDTMKQLAKIQSALAIGDAIQNIAEFRKSIVNTFKELGKIPGVMQVITFVTKAWNMAMAANPVATLTIAITALISGIAALVYWFKKSADESAKQKASIEKSSKALDDLKESTAKSNQELDRNQKQQLAMAKATGKSAEEIRKLELKLADEKIATAKATAETAKNTLEREKNALAMLKQQDADDDRIKEQEAVLKKAEDFNTESIKGLETAELAKTDIINKQEVERAQATTDANNKANEKAKQQAEEQKRKAEETAKAILEANKKADQDLRKMKEENIILSISDERMRQKVKLEQDLENQKKEIDASLANAGKKNQLKILAEEKYNLDLQELQKKFDEEDKKKKEEKDKKDAEDRKKKLEDQLKAEAETNDLVEQARLSQIKNSAVKRQEEEAIRYQKEVDNLYNALNNKEITEADFNARREALKTLHEGKLTEIEKANSDERQKKAEEEHQKKVAQIKSVGDTMTALTDVVGKETAAGKALGIAQATINTYLGATEVLRAKSVLPEPAGTIVKLANVAAIIASGIKSVKAIVGTKVPGAGGGGGSVPSATAPITPQMSSTAMNQAMINQMGNASTRAFVLESDVSGNQERIRRLNRAARIN